MLIKIGYGLVLLGANLLQSSIPKIVFDEREIDQFGSQRLN